MRFPGEVLLDISDMRITMKGDYPLKITKMFYDVVEASSKFTMLQVIEESPLQRWSRLEQKSDSDLTKSKEQLSSPCMHHGAVYMQKSNDR